MRLARPLLSVVVLAAVFAAWLGLASAAPAVSFGRGAFGGTEYVLVARAAGARDALWLVNPEDGTSTAAGDLPGHAGAVALSPNGLSVAYLPASSRPRVWLADGSGDATVISLLSAGVVRVQGLTWIDDHRLIVSGASRRSANLALYHLYVVDVGAQTVRPFRKLSGVEPSAAPGAGKLAYVRVTRLSGGSAPLVREDLKLLTVKGTAGGRTIATTRYRLRADRRAYSRPLLSPDAQWFLTGKTGSDVRVTYALRDRGGSALLTIFSPSPQAGAWDAAGGRAALGGAVPSAATTDACVWVYDVAGGTLLRTPAGLLGDVMMTSLAWSPSGTRLAAEAWGYDAQGSSRHLFVLPSDLTWFRDLGTGGLPVWIVQ